MNMTTKTLNIVFLILLSTTGISAQSFGFGCLGLSGVFGGYSIQEFEVVGLDEGISQFCASDQTDYKTGSFDRVEGYRVGANIFRARFNNFFITTKGYYQFLKKKDWSYISNQREVKSDEFQLSMNHWGLALDLGFPILSFVDWKILEGGINFYDIDFDYASIANQDISKLHYTTDEVVIGYFAGTGVIIHIIPDYMSIEGTAVYNFLNFNKFSQMDTDPFGFNNPDKDIVKGKFGAIVQLNIGVPL